MSLHLRNTFLDKDRVFQRLYNEVKHLLNINETSRNFAQNFTVFELHFQFFGQAQLCTICIIIRQKPRDVEHIVVVRKVSNLERKMISINH